MAGREIILKVTNERVGYCWQWNYMAGKDESGNYKDPYLYLVPTYQMNLVVKCGREEWTVAAFEVVRFSPGLSEDGGRTIIGVRKEPVTGKGPTKEIEAWFDYEPQSGAASRGAWIIQGDRLVHDGQDYPSNIKEQLMGGKGCIEVCGPGQWQELNKKILEELCLTGPEDINTKLNQAAKSMKITFEPADFRKLYRIPASDRDDAQKVKAKETEFIGKEFGPPGPPGLSPPPSGWGLPVCSGSSQIDLCNCDPCPPPDKPGEAPGTWRHDPLLVNLDGNGIQTLGLDAGIYFDHDSNGFLERTGWIAAGSGGENAPRQWR